LCREPLQPSSVSRFEIWVTALYRTCEGSTIAPDYFALNFGRLVDPAPGDSLLVLSICVLAIRRSRRIG